MSNDKLNQNLAIGAAMVVGLFSTLSSLFFAPKKNKKWSERAKEMADQLMQRRDLMMKKKLILGGITGGIVGVATALLLAPKAGSDLIKDMYRPLNRSQTSQKKSPGHSRKKVSDESHAKKSPQGKNGHKSSSKAHATPQAAASHTPKKIAPKKNTAGKTSSKKATSHPTTSHGNSPNHGHQENKIVESIK